MFSDVKTKHADFARDLLAKLFRSELNETYAASSSVTQRVFLYLFRTLVFHFCSINTL